MTSAADSRALDAGDLRQHVPPHAEANGAMAAFYAALAAAQGKFPAITRSRTVTVKTQAGVTYSFDYAPLDAILHAVRPVLAECGLCVTQALTHQGGIVGLETTIGHKDGGALVSFLPLTLPGKPQEVGSLLTYYRRYALTAALGIASEEDDDGNAGQGNQRPLRGREKPPAGAARPPIGPPATAPGVIVPPESGGAPLPRDTRTTLYDPQTGRPAPPREPGETPHPSYGSSSNTQADDDPVRGSRSREPGEDDDPEEMLARLHARPEDFDHDISPTEEPDSAERPNVRLRNKARTAFMVALRAEVKEGRRDSVTLARSDEGSYRRGELVCGLLGIEHTPEFASNALTVAQWSIARIELLRRGAQAKQGAK